MSKSTRASSLVILVSCLAVGCASGTSVPAQPTPLPFPTLEPTFTLLPTFTAIPTESRPTSTPIPSPSPVAADQMFGFGYGPINFPEEINPLTGLLAAKPELLRRRPMAIKITNFPRSVRPQWGLNSADHVYEYFLEGELTRFIGIFYGRDAERVGPIRSARIFDSEIVRMYKAIFTFAYADDRVMDYLLESDLRNLLVIQRPGNCPPLCRIGPDYDYNTLYTDTSQLSQYVTERGTSNENQNLDGLRYEEKSLIAFGGGTADSLNVFYTNQSFHRWDYDPITRRYLRFQETGAYDEVGEAYEPLVDSLDGEQVAADNLVVLMAPIKLFFESHSTEIYEILLEGSGEAFALREGKIFQVYWERPGPASLLNLKQSNGTPYPLKPGSVWFIVLGQTSHYQRISNRVWRFVFSIP